MLPACSVVVFNRACVIWKWACFEAKILNWWSQTCKLSTSVQFLKKIPLRYLDKRLTRIQTHNTVILSQCATYFLCCQQRWGQEWRPGGLKRQDTEAEEKQKGTARCGKTRGHSIRSSTPAPLYAGGCRTTDGGREVWTHWPWSWSCTQRSRIFRISQAAALRHSGQRPTVWRPFTASRLDAQAETAQVWAICWQIWCLPDQVSTSYRKLVLFWEQLWRYSFHNVHSKWHIQQNSHY